MMRHAIFRYTKRWGIRIGLSVSHDLVGVVLVRGDEVLWSAVEPIGPGDTLMDTITQLLQKLPDIPTPRWLSVRVWVTLDNPLNRVKTIRGLPPVSNPRVLAQLLAVTPERFFVGTTAGVVTTGVRVLEPGVIEAAVFDAATLMTICEACEGGGWSVASITPAAVAMAAVSHEISFDGVYRDTHGDAHVVLVAAFGATHLANDEPIVVHPVRQKISPESSHSWSNSRRRLLIAGIAAIMSIGAAASTPVLIAWHTKRIACQTITSLAATRTRALVAEREVNRMATIIATVINFEQHRLSKTLVLAALTEGLPTRAAITTLKVDTTGVTIVAIAPHAATLVQGITEIPGTSHVEMLGSIIQDGTTSEWNSIGATLATPLERVTVRFRPASDIVSIRRPLAIESTSQSASVAH